MPRPKKIVDPNATPKEKKPRAPRVKKLDPETGEPIKPVRKPEPKKKTSVHKLVKGDRICMFTKDKGLEFFTFERVDMFFSISIADIKADDGSDRILRLPCTQPIRYNSDGFYELIDVLAEAQAKFGKP